MDDRLTHDADAALLGFALNSVMGALPDPEMLFADFDRKDELVGLVNEQSYPVSLYVAMTAHIEQQFGRGAMLSLGKKVGAMVVDVSLEPMNLADVQSAMRAVQLAHEQFCEPTVGAFEVVFEDARALHLKYTAPYNCVLQEGLFYAISKHYGSQLPVVTQLQCRRDGGDHCLYSIGK